MDSMGLVIYLSRRMFLSMTHGIEDLATVFRALGDPTRLRILALIGRDEMCVCHIHEALRLPQPTVSRHLAYLRRSGLVDTRRDGLWVHYRLALPEDPSVRAAVEAAIHAVGHVPSFHADRRRLTGQGDRPPESDVLPVSTCCSPAVIQRRS
jgi:ArsR family transcriptional regulator